AGIVVTVAAQHRQAVIRSRLGRQVVPLMTRDLTRFAADANRRIGVESNGFRHKASCHRLNLLTIRRRTRPNAVNRNCPGAIINRVKYSVITDSHAKSFPFAPLELGNSPWPRLSRQRL